MGLLDGVDKAKREYLTTPWAGKARIVQVKTSLQEGGYTGSPYIAFIVQLPDGIKQDARFWTPKADDDQNKKNGKLLRIKEFLENIGVDTSLPEDEIYRQAVGKEAYFAFAKRSYIGKEKTGRPTMKTGIDFAYANPVSKPFGATVNEQTLTRELKPDDWAKLKTQQAHWDATNNPMGAAPAPASTASTASAAAPQLDLSGGEDIDDDLPF
jgi:hypothetical protein